MNDQLEHEAVETITYLLEGFGLLEELEEADKGEKVKGRYTLNQYYAGSSLIINIVASGDLGAVLTGREGTTLAALQRTFFAALGFRMGGSGSINRPVWLNINGRRPDLRQTSDDRPQEPAEPPVVRVTIATPPGVKVEVATQTG
jgi:hypothetical protein